MSISTIRVTFQASRSVVGNVFLIVLFVHLRLVMAAEACPRLGARGMAASTITIGITMAHGKAVIERGTLPVRGVMALRALTLEVIGWLVTEMACLTVRRPNRLVVESAAAPTRGVMALRALPLEVVGWLVTEMACLTVRGSHGLMVEGGVAPRRGVMTLRA
ncbi:MAG: hypothetical protein MUO67_02065, partial [Anaerolineales bacterium]|nr:hypothetical protein [Anaerolineales bacterium]